MNEKAERDQQQHDADDPVELARLLVGAGVEDAHHVEEDDEHHQVGRPPVHVADELAEADARLEVLHVAVGGARRRRVHEHQVDAGDRQDPEQHRGDVAEPERVPQAQDPRRHLHRVDVQEEVAERLQGAPARRVELWMAEHRAPHRRCAAPSRSSPVRASRPRARARPRLVRHARPPSHRPSRARRRAAIHAETAADAVILVEQERRLGHRTDADRDRPARS